MTAATVTIKVAFRTARRRLDPIPAKATAPTAIARRLALAHHVEDTVRVMGPDYWSYGIEKNRHVLDACAQYALEQGLLERPLDVDSIWAPEARDVIANTAGGLA